MSWLLALVWNDEERRVRALWRVILHGLTLVVLAIVMSVLAKLLGLGSIGGLSARGTVIVALVVALGTFICGRGLDRRRLVDFGLELSPRWWADLGAGVVIGAISMALIFVVELGAGWLTIEARAVGGAPGQPFALALVDPFVVFIAVGFYEELLSRGYHLRNLAEGLRGLKLGVEIGPGAALVLATLLSASVFGMLHLGNHNASAISTINIGLAGCMLAAGLIWTGQLALPIGLHLGWNFCQGNVFGFAVSGNLVGPRVFAIEQGGDPLITGGAFGPEAGLIGLAAMLVALGLQALWTRVAHGQLRVHHELSAPGPAGPAGSA